MTRIELHRDATWDDYELLHRKMSEEGFGRSVVGSDGVTYRLPPAEYLIQGSYEIATVLQAAVRASSATGKHVSALVTEGERLSWRGLQSI